MPPVNMTALWLRGLKPDRSRRRTFADLDTPGLLLRVTPGGVQTWSVWYRYRGRPRRLTIGRYPEWSLAEARQRAREALADSGRDVDAAAVKRAKRIEAQRAALRGGTFRELAERCLEAIGPRLRPRTLEEYHRALKADVYAKIGRIAPERIERADIRALIAKKASGAGIQANRTFGVIRRVFSWALSEELVVVSPCAGLRPPSTERIRERVHSDDEVRALLKASRGSELEHLVNLLFRTATRTEETRSARWADIDFDRALWTIPGSVAKNRESHPVALSAGALELFKARRRVILVGCPWVFPSIRSEAGYMSNPGIDTMRTFRESAGVPDFRFHDIRRTVATRLAEAGVSVSVIEAVLGHRPPRLVRTYQKHGYVPEMSAALNAWDARLTEIVSKAATGGQRSVG